MRAESAARVVEVVRVVSVVRVAAGFENPEDFLRSGMTGNVVIDAEGGSPGLIRSLWQEIAGVGR